MMLLDFFTLTINVPFALMLLLTAFVIGFGLGAIDTLNYIAKRPDPTLVPEEREP